MIEKYEAMRIIGPKELYSEQLYEIFEDSEIELSGEFRSEGSIGSRLFFGLRCYKENKSEIHSRLVWREQDSFVITSINKDGKTLFLNQNKVDTCRQHKKCIGIYLDGNTNNLPNFLLEYAKIENNEIQLIEKMPNDVLNKIKIWISKVIIHYANGTFDYSACGGDIVPNNWTKYEAKYYGNIQAFNFEKGKLRPETKFISPFILANHYQDNKSILEIKNIQLNIKFKPKLA